MNYTTQIQFLNTIYQDNTDYYLKIMGNKEEIDLSYVQLITELLPVYMLIGFGSKNQFKNLNTLEKKLDHIAETLPKYGSILLYFGDAPNKDKPDIGYAFQLLSNKLKKIDKNVIILMIQIEEAKSWGVPDFVDYVYWHKDYTEKCKWGGLDEKGMPCSNTKIWYDLVKNGADFKKAFVLGGGPITETEIRLLLSLHSPVEIHVMERKFLGDGTTPVERNEKDKEKLYGPLYIYKF